MAIARQMGPQALRMNLNTLLRHDVFKQSSSVVPTEESRLGQSCHTGNPDNTMIDYVASRIADADAITRSRQFPYQFLAAYLNASAEVPQKIFKSSKSEIRRVKIRIAALGRAFHTSLFLLRTSVDPAS